MKSELRDILLANFTQTTYATLIIIFTAMATRPLLYILDKYTPISISFFDAMSLCLVSGIGSLIVVQTLGIAAAIDQSVKTTDSTEERP